MDSVRQIKGIDLSLFAGQTDMPRWRLTSSGQYTTKSGYYVLSLQQEISNMNLPFHLNPLGVGHHA